MRRFAYLAAGLLALPYLVVISLMHVGNRSRLIWGPVPIINHKYWSEAMKKAGWDSLTLMDGHFAINERSDFDVYFDDLMPGWVPKPIRRAVAPYRACAFAIRNARVLHIPFSGGPLGSTPFWRVEAHLLKLAGIRTVVVPHGGDSYRYSTVEDASLRHALLASYPHQARREGEISARVFYWSKYADAVIVGFGIDGIPRWDVTINNMIAIDVDAWKPRSTYSLNDGVNGPVRVFHSANHRGYKGTEFIVRAVEALRSKGLDVLLELAEGLTNREVRTRLQQCDVAVEQLLYTGYALAGIEAMACGLPVIANLEDESRTALFRRYAFLNQCPILSAGPETIEKQLELLITNPDLREQLGKAGRQYVDRFHSYKTAQYLFGSIYRVILDGENIDLHNLFNPITSDFVSRQDPIGHPLVLNQFVKDE